jgi:hypothetical protein
MSTKVDTREPFLMLKGITDVNYIAHLSRTVSAIGVLSGTYQWVSTGWDKYLNKSYGDLIIEKFPDGWSETIKLWKRDKKKSSHGYFFAMDSAGSMISVYELDGITVNWIIPGTPRDFKTVERISFHVEHHKYTQRFNDPPYD